MIDFKTNSIIKTDKMELYDKVLAGNLNKLEKLSADSEFKPEEKLKYANDVERLKKILFNNKKGIKKYYSEINLLSYNNKDLIQDTWNGLKKLDELVITNKINSSNMINYNVPVNNNSDDNTNSESSDIESDEEINTAKLNKFRKQFNVPNTTKLIPDEYNESDSELSDSDVDDQDDVLIEITIKGKHYVVVKENIFGKNPDGSPGELYGRYVNGKIIKKKSAQREINL